MTNDLAAEQQLAIILRTRQLLLERASPVVHLEVIEAAGTDAAEEGRPSGDLQSLPGESRSDAEEGERSPRR
jgi:hypothetical protein